jgi:hypothetical protein
MQHSMSRKATAICVFDEANWIVAEKKIATRPDVIAAWADEDRPGSCSRRDGDRTISCMVMERASRQRSADQLHGRPAANAIPEASFLD